MSKSRSLLAGAVVAASLLGSGDATAWKTEAPFRATVNDHVFDLVKVTNEGCIARFALYFDAPKNKYEDENPVRNRYEFRALIKMEGRRLQTRRFFNRKPGRRKYVYTHDSSGDGCWAEKPQKLHGVVVNGCRNRGCRIEAFD